MRTERDALLSLQRYVNQALPDLVEVLTEVEHETPARPFAVVSGDGDAATGGTYSSREITLPATVYVYVEGDTRKRARELAEDARDALWAAFEAGEVPRHFPLFDYSGKPAVQLVKLTGARGGTWALDLEGTRTVDIDWQAQPVEVREAMEELVGVGRISVIGKAGGPWALRFERELRGVNMATVELDTSSLIGAGGGVEVLSVGDPEPWRDPREYVRIDQANYGTLRDPADPRLRTVTVGLRLTWGRAGHVTSPEMTLLGITARVR